MTPLSTHLNHFDISVITLFKTILKLQLFSPSVPPLILDMDAVRDTVEEEAVDIKCTVEGDPAPSMLWRKIGDSAPIADVPSGVRNFFFPLSSLLFLILVLLL